MNSSEIKKIIWFVNLIVFGGFGVVAYFAWSLSSEPLPTIAAFRYAEPQIQDTEIKRRDMVLLSEVTDVFGEKKVEIPKPPPRDPNADKPVVVPVAPPKPEIQGVDRLLELHHILGRLAFVYVKKDRILKTVVVDEEITTLSDETIGVLKEIRGDHVLILLNGKIETLHIDPQSLKGEAGASSESEPEPEVTPATGTTGQGGGGGGRRGNRGSGQGGQGQGQGQGRRGSSNFTPQENVPKPTHNVTNANTATADKPVIAEADTAPVQPEIKIENVQSETFHGQPYEFAEIREKDGVVRKQIPVAMARQLQSRENMVKFLDPNNYGFVYRQDGIFVQKINDSDIAKFFSVIGVQVGDVIVRANGQHLGNKSDDHLLELVQQIVDSNTHLDLEFKHKGADRRVRVAVGEIKGNFNK